MQWTFSPGNFSKPSVGINVLLFMQGSIILLLVQFHKSSGLGFYAKLSNRLHPNLLTLDVYVHVFPFTLTRFARILWGLLLSLQETCVIFPFNKHGELWAPRFGSKLSLLLTFLLLMTVYLGKRLFYFLVSHLFWTAILTSWLLLFYFFLLNC